MKRYKSKFDGRYKAGDTFGAWTVVDGSVKRLGARTSGYGDAALDVKCVCGTNKIVAINTLENGTSTSCGCDYRPTGSENPRWAGQGVVSKSVLNASPVSNISINYAAGLADSQSYTCAISHVPLDFSNGGNARLINDTTPTWVHSGVQALVKSCNENELISICSNILQDRGYSINPPKQTTNPLIAACVNAAKKHK